MIADQIAALQGEMQLRPVGLQHHVKRVLVEALQLARVWLVDEERVELAVWGHDLFRAEPPAEQLRLARSVGIPIDADEETHPILLHGPVAAAVLRERWSITDEEVLVAVRDHTAGLGEMSVLAKILLVSDKVEATKRRGKPALTGLRQLARRDLDTAILCWGDWRWVAEASRGMAPQRAHWRARCQWVSNHHSEVGMPIRIPDDMFEA